MQTTENPIYALVAGSMFSGETHLDKHLAQVTLKYISNFNSMTVERMAELCQVSVSTYLRFCKKLGYSSFTEFRVRIVDALGKYKFLNTPFSLLFVHNSANTAVANEKHSYHIFLTPILSWIFSVFPYFMGLCAHFQSIDHFSVSRLILAYLGIFIPPTGLNIGLKWTIFSSLDHWLFLVYFRSF